MPRDGVAARQTRACCASAIAIRSTAVSAGLSGSGLALALRISSSWRGEPAAPGPTGGTTTPRPELPGVTCSVRYLSTSAAIPCSFNHRATFTPSLSQPRTRNAPPGATTIAAPVAAEGGGRNTVTDGSLTFAIVRSPEGDAVTVSGMVQASEPGAFAGHSLISVGAWPAASAAMASIAATRRCRRIATPYRIPFFWIVQTCSVQRRQSAPTNHFAASALPFS